MAVESLTSYSVQELNGAIKNLVERGFPPRFLLHASVSKAQLKKGHLWLSLSDSKASINAVVWSSIINKINFRPKEGDGVLIVGKLNFWEARASLMVQVLDIRPSISTVLRQFEVVKKILFEDGLIDSSRHRKLPKYPRAIAIFTSVPSSALADMIRTAKDRWPLSKLFIIPIPVQGDVANKIQSALKKLSITLEELEIDAIVLARGGGAREDLMVFDNELLCRTLADYPVPVVSGLGHEDDLTVADLVVDHRAATPTAAIVALLPSRETAIEYCLQRKERLNDYSSWIIRQERQRLIEKKQALSLYTPLKIVKLRLARLSEKSQILNALSPERWLLKGFAIVRNSNKIPIAQTKQVSLHEKLTIEFSDGFIDTVVENISPNGAVK